MWIMTNREKAIVTAYTGIWMLEGESFEEFYKYLEELYGRLVYTHELVILDIKERSKDDFIELCRKEDKPDYLSDDDREIIRIHLRAIKERLCNQYRWNEAQKYEEIINRLMKHGGAIK